MPTSSHADLAALAAQAAGPGSAWHAEVGDLRARLVVVPAGADLAGHVNREADLLVVGVSGRGTVAVDEAEVALEPGVAVMIPKGAHRRVGAGTETLAFLAVHRRTPVSPTWRWRPRRRRPWEDPWEDDA